MRNFTLSFLLLVVLVATVIGLLGHCNIVRWLGCCKAPVLVRKVVPTQIDDRFVNEPKTDPGPPRRCRADSFFIEVPLARSPLWTQTSFLPEVARELTAFARGDHEWLFCGANRCPDPSRISADVTPVLDEKKYHRDREDGHLRFFRVRFKDSAPEPDDNPILAINDRAHCEVVAAVRSFFVEHALASEQRGLGALGTFPSDFVRVGRECDALPLSTADLFTPVRRAWHLNALEATRNHPRPNGADIVLIDSGVAGADVNALVANPNDQEVVNALAPAANPPAGMHNHGTAMAKLMDEIAPNIPIFSYRAIDVYGFATTEGIARALDKALDEATARGPRPQIINLSLGWSPSKGRNAYLRGQKSNGAVCETIEHGVGESIRYLLYLARALDTDSRQTNPKTPRISVIAAAGNRARPPTNSDGSELEFTTADAPVAIRGQDYRATFTVRDPQAIRQLMRGRFTITGGKFPSNVAPVVAAPTVQAPNIVLEIKKRASADSRVTGESNATENTAELVRGSQIVRGQMPVVGSNGSVFINVRGKIADNAQTSTVTIRYTDDRNRSRFVEKTFLIRVQDSGCVADQGDVDWFYPARWEREQTCRSADEPAFSLAWAIGGVDSRLLPGTLSQRNPIPSIVAPGEFVYVDGPMASFVVEPQPMIAPSDTYAPGPEAPGFYSGTSVAAALVSAVAAHGQARITEVQKRALDSETLRKWVTSTGRIVRTAGRNVMPSVAGLERAITTNKLPPLSQFATTAGLRAKSNYEVTLSPGKTVVTVTDAIPIPIAEYRNFLDKESAYGTLTAPNGPDQFELGSVGPMPSDPFCPTCTEIFEAPIVRLDLDLNPYFADAVFHNPFLSIEDGNTGEIVVIPLPEDSLVKWVPGDHLQLEIVWEEGFGIDYFKSKLSIGAEIEFDGETTIDTSVLERQDR